MNNIEESPRKKEFYILNGVVTKLSDPEALARLGHSVIPFNEAKVGERYVMAASESDGATVIISRVS